MSNFWQRTITGAILISVIIGSVLYGSLSAFLFFGLVGVLGLNEFLKITLPTQKHFLTLFIGLITVVLFGLFAESRIDSLWFWVLIPFTLAIFLEGLFSVSEKGFNDVSIKITGLVYTILPMGITMLLLFKPDQNLYNYQTVLGTFIMIWCNDTFAYITGRAIGKTKLFERISPKKTIEGTLGGMLISALIGYFVIAHFYTTISQTNWAIGALIVGIGGTLGDLFESLLKRNYNIKDSGTILPGHGGILDRFDSALFALPLFYFWLVFVSLF